MHPAVAEHVPLQSKSLCKNIERASGGRKYYAIMHPVSWGGGGGGTSGKD